MGQMTNRGSNSSVDLSQGGRGDEARFRLIADNSRDVIACSTVEGTLTYVSPSCLECFGYGQDELIGHNWAEIIHPDDLARVFATAPGAGGNPQKVSFRVRRKDASWVWIESHARTITDPETGEVIEYQTAARDISDRMQSEEALRNQTTIYEAMLNAQSDLGEGCLIAENQHFLYANDAYCRISGYSREELAAVGTLMDLTTPAQRIALTERMRKREAGERVPDQYETEMIRKDGVRIDLEVSHRVVQVEGRGRYVTIVRDITERKRAENALRESERRFAELYEREKEAAERLRSLDEMKNSFLAAVSHELRTPLTSILGLAHTLEDSGTQMLEDERLDFTHRIVQNAEKLHRLLADLLDVDRARLGLLEPRRHRLDLGELARTTTEEWMIASGRTASVKAGHVSARVDGAKVERIIENLLSNAAKHTQENAHIWVRVEEADNGTVIVVEDDGSGVRDDLKQVIFDPFVRGEGTSRRAPGTGIGLSLVSQFSALHGGSAWVEDRPGGGASFHVYLPDGQSN